MSARRDQLIAAGLIKIADRCSEALAAASTDGISSSCLADQIADINKLVWELRWEVGPAGGKAELDRDYLADIKEMEAAQ